MALSIDDFTDNRPEDAEPIAPVNFSADEYTPPDPLTPATPAESPSVLKDVLFAPFRGLEGFGQSAYKLADFLTADALPDFWDKRFLGKSETMTGGFIEGAAQFLIGFVPGMGIAGAAGKALGVAKAVGGASKAVKGAANLAKYTGVGAAVDFVGFGANDERLSNFIQTMPSLRNPITEYLAADENDGELEGRLKNAIEGAGLGLALDGIVACVKYGRIARLLQEGKAKEADLKAAKEKAETASEKALTALRKEGDAAEAGVVKDVPKAKVMTSDDESVLSEWGKIIAHNDPVTIGAARNKPGRPISSLINTGEDVEKLIEYISKNIDDHIVDGAKPGKTDITKGDIINTPRTRAVAEEDAKRILSDHFGMSEGEILEFHQRRLAMGQEVMKSAYALQKLSVALAEEAVGFSGSVGKKRSEVLRIVDDTADALAKEDTISAEEAKVLTFQALAANMRVALVVKQYKRLAGQTLRQFGYKATSGKQSKELAKEILQNLGGDEFVTEHINKVMSVYQMAGGGTDGAKALLDATKATTSLGDKVFRAHNEFWINSILSGPKTTIVNTLGNVTATLWKPFETAVGGLMQGNTKAARASLKNFQFLWRNVGDAWSLARKAMRENQSSFSRSGINDLITQPAIDASNFGGPASRGLVGDAKAIAGGEQNLLWHAMNFFGQVTRLPQRFLMSQDEFFKQLNRRSAVQTELYYRALDQGLDGEVRDLFIENNLQGIVRDGSKRFTEAGVYRTAIEQAQAKGLEGRARGEFIQDFVEKNFNPESSALQEAFHIDNYGKAIADESTFTSELGSMGKGVQAFARAHPLFQLIVPFVRTPTNLVKYMARRSAGISVQMPGVGALQKQIISELSSSDALVRSQALGRIGAGSLITSSAALLVMGGRVTGSGPRDEHERKLLMQTGWQPYSFRIDTEGGTEYISYQRLDPFASMFGILADAVEGYKEPNPLKSDVLETLFTSVATALTKNVTNKTYLTSLSDIMEVLSDPARRFPGWAKTRIASYVPSAITAGTAITGEADELAEIRGWFDGAVSRIPGFNQSLERQRNVLGEPVSTVSANTPGVVSAVNPFTYSPDKGDAVMKELADLKHGLQPMSPVMHGLLNLLDYKTPSGQTAYDRVQQLSGEVKIQGKTLRQTLGELISKKEYQKLPKASEIDGYESPRLSAVRRVIRAYRRTAEAQLQQEIPALREAVSAYHDDRIKIRRGERAQQLQALLNK